MRHLVFIGLLFCLTACHSKLPVDLLIYNGTIYTVDSAFTKAEAVAVKGGKIVAVGTSRDMQNKYVAQKNIDAQGKFVYPGWIDAHAHFLSYGQNLQQVDLRGTDSWEDVLKTLRKYVDRKNRQNAQTGGDTDTGWIIGSGWDQNDWTDKNFPNNQQLNTLYPDRPVLLSRVDGHAIIANQKALDLAGIKATDSIAGGEIQTSDGHLTGVLVDNATELVYKSIPEPPVEEITAALLAAQDKCFAAGLTTIDDCGEDYRLTLLIDSLNRSGLLKMRLYVLLSDNKKNFDYLTKTGKIKTDYLHVAGFKLFADGALGSRGACLLASYSDQPGWDGFLLQPQKHYDSVAKFLYQHDFQMCTHAIGDSANRVMLKIYAKYLKGKNDRRWRIEHAQIISPADIHYFGDYNIIPSVQPTHATSDMYWAETRLGPERIQSAYANQKLLLQNGWLPLGTDFPVEDISPVKTFYAAVTRMDAKGWPAGGFQMENALTRQQALRGMTIWAAKANFEEKEKGSIETGKWGDFVITDKDLLQVDQKDILKTRVLMTFVGGEKVYDRAGKPILQ